MDQAHDADHHRLIRLGGGLAPGLRLADETISTGGNLADTTGAGR
ncbi:hypothetical protein I553_7665 [Mycobacterium xenopi 4042]|uniref:Uncharacterized protein n=1 Tax=Mycobacterium xenopi 4042 TaxID=1299334 RepID=X8AR38_MYCXE|nr:hypothetical protein I552_9500 [Mycobacterium xenopi 3993]EUA33255.1 hypothetical protein I553_7665 [Mycobacterium xenopi 4042]